MFRKKASPPPNASPRFVDYFVVCGLDTVSGLEVDPVIGDSPHRWPLQRSFKSSVLAHFPDQAPGNPFDGDAFRLLCLPRGLLFAKEGHVPEPQFHSFLVTKEDGSRVYGSALTFYELVTTGKVLDALEMLQAMYKQEVKLQRGVSPQERQRDDINGEDFEFDGKQGDRIFVCQCIAFVSKIPFIWAYEQYLSQLYELSRDNDSVLPMESYIYNLLFEVPLPPPGRSLRLTGPKGPITCIRPNKERSLPLLEYPIKRLFDWLTLDDIILIFTCFLLEHQILLIASKYHKLMTTAECFSALMLPFSWQHVYVPILPRSLLHYLDAPVPFIMGLQRLPCDKRPDVPGEVVTVDLDNSKVNGPEDIPDLPNYYHLKRLIEMKLDDFTPNNSGISTRRGSLNSQGSGSLSRNVSMNKLEPVLEEDRLSPPSKEEETESQEGKKANMSNKEKEMKQKKPQSIHPQLAQMLQLARKAGIETSISHLLSSSEDTETETNGTVNSNSKEETDGGILPEQQTDMDFNNNIREVFLQYFVQLFADYDKFVIPPQSDYQTWLTSREHLQNFDKAAFLSDQPERYLPFLSPFLETQSFASLIDNKILSSWHPCDPLLALFDSRIQELKQTRGVLRSPSEEIAAQTVQVSLQKLSFRNLRIDHRARPPRKLSSLSAREDADAVDAPGEGQFARLHSSTLLNQGSSEVSDKKSHASWSRSQKRQQQWEHLLASGQNLVQEARKNASPQPPFSNSSPESMNKSQGSFVLHLLKEARMKVKRLLVQKMGREAFIMGHGELRGRSVTGVEENTLIASLCDLLERIWSHGLNVAREGRSCLWSHLMAYMSRKEETEANTNALLSKRYSMPNMHKDKSAAPRKWSGGGLIATDDEPCDGEKQSKLASLRNWAFGSPEMRRRITNLLMPTPPDFVYDLQCVQNMADIKTQVGFARAWIRLALEKKQLADHLKMLLSDNELVTARYRDYAFLRSEDEREQFLFHLLSLTAVDFRCFTLGFANTLVTYRISFVTGKSLTSSTTTANLWIMLSGENANTGRVPIPRGEYDVDLKHPNLGLLTTLRVGHDNAGISPGIFIEMIIIRNLVTDTVWKFPCGRWLAKGEDDRSIERLLVGEIEDRNPVSRISKELTPPRSESPKVSRKDDRVENSVIVDDYLQAIADVVNQMIKHCTEPAAEGHSSLSFLLCGERGLCQAIHNVFVYNLRSRRFRSNLLPWDYIQKVYESLARLTTSGNTTRKISPTPQMLFKQNTSGDLPHIPARELTQSENTFVLTIAKISSASNTIGKDGKFQAFVCLGARDHQLSNWMAVLSQSTVAETFYEPSSFFRQQQLMTPLLTTLSALNDMNIKLETAILKGIEDD